MPENLQDRQKRNESLESRMMGNYHVRFGGGRLEKELSATSLAAYPTRGRPQRYNANFAGRVLAQCQYNGCGAATSHPFFVLCAKCARPLLLSGALHTITTSYNHTLCSRQEYGRSGLRKRERIPAPSTPQLLPACGNQVVCHTVKGHDEQQNDLLPLTACVVRCVPHA